MTTTLDEANLTLLDASLDDAPRCEQYAKTDKIPDCENEADFLCSLICCPRVEPFYICRMCLDRLTEKLRSLSNPVCGTCRLPISTIESWLNLVPVKP